MDILYHYHYHYYLFCFLMLHVRGPSTTPIKPRKKPSSREKPLGVPNHLGLAERKLYGFQSKDFIPSEKSTWGFVSYGLTDLINKDLQRVRTLARQTSGIKRMLISILHIQTNLSFGYKFVHSSQVLVFVSFCFVWTHKKKNIPPGNRNHLGLALLGGPSGGIGTSSTGLQLERWWKIRTLPKTNSSAPGKFVPELPKRKTNHTSEDKSRDCPPFFRGSSCC